MSNAIDRTGDENVLSLSCPLLSLKRRGKDRTDSKGQEKKCPVLPTFRCYLAILLVLRTGGQEDPYLCV